MSHAFSTVASERARETKARDELRRQQQRVETTEKFSGLRIKNRLVASAVLEDKFADLRFARIPDIKLDMRGRWATAGVLVEKTMKQGSTGASYSIWKLSDMSPTDYVFTVFLFGQAHLDWHREDPGTVWALVDGELREDTKAGPAGRPTAACNEPHQLCKLGVSPVFGRCKGTRRDGNDCTMHVNVSVSNYCAFHANAALKSLATERMGLGPGRSAKFVQNGKTVMGARGRGGRMNVPPGVLGNASGTFSGGSAASGNRHRRQIEPAPRAYTADQVQKIAAKNQHSSMTGRGAALVTGGAVGGKRAHPGLGGRVRDRDGDDRTGRAAAAALGPFPGGSGPSARFGSDPGSGSAQVSRAQVLANKKLRTAAADARVPRLVTADSGLGGGFRGGDEKENARSTAPRKETRAPKPSTEARKFVAMEDDDDFDADLDALSAVARARAVAKAMKPHDPNAFRRATKAIRVDPAAAAKRVAPPPLPGLAPAASKSPAKAASRPWPVPGARGGVPTPSPRTTDPSVGIPTALGAAFGDVAAAHADGASRYEASAEALERDRLLARLRHLEEQDRLHTQVAETHILQVKCSMCECGALFEGRPRDACARAGHRARPHETKKRFFKCGACPFRISTLGKPFPPTPCPRCRCEDWDKCGMSAAAERTKAGAGFGEDVGNREGMLARGVEHGFSLRGGGFAGPAGHLESELDLR